MTAHGVDIEIVERQPHPDGPQVVCPNNVIISSDNVVVVTVPMFVRSLTIRPADDTNPQVRAV